MMSNRTWRQVEVQTPPFSAIAIVKAGEMDQIWATAKAEAMLIEQIQVQVGLKIANMALLRKLGVYTVEHKVETGHFVHRVDAPDGITFHGVEEVPRWWEAEDTIPMDKVPNGQALMIALLPTLSVDAWRRNAWPDRPHP